MRTMRPWTNRVVGLAIALALLAPTGAVAATPDITFSGSGWGHGVGLSQYGAKAMGADGATWQQIVDRYFTGVSIGPPSTVAAGTFVATDSDPLWVGLLQDSSIVSFSIQSGSAQLCFDGAAGCVVTAEVGESWRYGPDGTGGCVFMRLTATGVWSAVAASSGCAASVDPVGGTAVVNIPFKARSYRDATIRFRETPTGARVHTVLEIGIDAYLRGLAPVPESWAPSTLRAQAVVSRSNALWHALNRGAEPTFDIARRQACHCNLYDGSPDQVFQGQTGESRHPNWVAAVEATAQQVMGWQGSVALGEFSSSSGGWTDAYSDAFGGATHPYLASVDDSAAYSTSASNPHVSWGAGFDQSILASAFGFSWINDVQVASRNTSGSTATLRLAGIRSGRPMVDTISAVDLREALGLRSTTFSVTVKPRFSDVPADHQFAGEVLGLAELEVTTGCTATDYCPTDSVTRGQMAAFLVRALGLTVGTGSDTFEDDDGSYFEAEIEALFAAGVTAGCSPTAFCPGRVVTRGEMAAFLVRGFGLLPAVGDSFVDDDGSFFEAEIEALVAAGVTSGCSAASFCPRAPLTREQMAAFLVRALALG